MGNVLTPLLQDYTLYFDEDVELAGYPSVKLYMSCEEHDDMDVVVQIRKISTRGEPLVHLNYPCPVSPSEVPDVNTAKMLGPQGFLRASHAVTQITPAAGSNEFFYQHDRRASITRGTVVALDITLWPIGMTFTQGEGIMLRIAGHDMCLPETEHIRPVRATDMNKGVHMVYTGGEFSSYLVIPVVPTLGSRR